jgi:translocation and assembly module TamA
MIALAAPLRAQTPAGDAASTPGYAFNIVIQAPPDVRVYLQRHMELQRYRELTDLDVGELNRLLAAARLNAQELLGTLGYFSPDIKLAVRDAAAGAGAPREVVITVLPGEPARISEVSIEFTGAIAQDPSAQEQRGAIRASWPLRPGMKFTQAQWDSAKSRTLRLLTTHRYPAGRLTSSLAEIDPATQTSRLSIVLDSGPAYQLGAVQISGLQRYDSAVALSLARLHSGSDYDQTQLLEAQQRLTDSGYFDSAFISLDTTGDPLAAPVMVQLREAKLQKIVLGIGASTDSGARLSVEHTHNRVPGLEWRAVSKLMLDRQTKSIGSELTAPPDGDNWRWVTSSQIVQQNAASFDVSSQRYRAGRTQSGDQVDRTYYLQYDRARTTSASSMVDADALTVNYAWTQRNFDSRPFPSTGLGLGVELGGGTTLGASQQPFVRIQARWLRLWSLASNEADLDTAARAGRIAVRLESGAVLARLEAQLPSTQLFLTGGDATVRGYGYRSIGTVLADGSIAAGRYMAVGSAEWQRPIVVNDQLTDWESALFIDGGAVADQISNLKAKVGVGAGVRWKSPVGPLQMDLAYGVAEKKFRLHLKVGFTF